MGCLRRGFTLIELMVALAIAAILASLALPSFVDSIRKSRRADAVAALTAIQQAQERRRANEPLYASDLNALGIASGTSAGGYYTLAISNAGVSGYTATATVAAGRSQAGDRQCHRLQIRAAGGNIFYDSACADCPADQPPADTNRCWSRP